MPPHAFLSIDGNTYLLTLTRRAGCSTGAAGVPDATSCFARSKITLRTHGTPPVFAGVLPSVFVRGGSPAIGGGAAAKEDAPKPLQRGHVRGKGALCA